MSRPRFYMRMMQGPSPSWAQKISSRGSPPLADERPAGSLPAVPGGGGAVLAGPVPPPPTPFHEGSPDLELWPPSAVELDLAGRWVDAADAGLYAAQAWGELFGVAGSAVRATGLVHRVRVERAAEAVIRRVTGP